MSGHSKWAQIKHQKAATDKKKGLLFAKLVRQINIAVKEGRGDGDPASNFRLRLVTEKAGAAGMPKDNIARAIQKAAGGGDGSQIENVIYEGFGPFGTAFMIEAATDSRNRTTANIRHLFEKFGGSMGQPNSVAWSFESRGQILAETRSGDTAAIQLAAIDAGAEDVKTSAEGLEIYTVPIDIKAVKESIESAGGVVVSAEVIRDAKTPVELGDEQEKQVHKLYNALHDDEDVIAVYTNGNLAD